MGEVKNGPQTSHDVDGSQVTPGELHGPEELVPNVGAEDVVLLLGDLAGQAHQDILDGVGGQKILKKDQLFVVQ
jgi:hypothetical protein